MINALGVTGDGVPRRLFARVWWSREEVKHQTRQQKKNRCRKRSAEESRYWLQAIDCATERAKEANVKLWFQLDREGDNGDLLLRLAETGHAFTVRGSWNRLTQATGTDNQYLRNSLATKAPRGNYRLHVAAAKRRTARAARMVVRVARVELRLRNPRGSNQRRCQVYAIGASEEGTCPRCEKPIDWLLPTNVPVHD